VIEPLHGAFRPRSWEREAKTGGRELRSNLPAAAPRGENPSPTDLLLLSWLSSTSGRLGAYARPGHGTAPRGATRPPLPRPGGSVDRGDRSSAGTRRSDHQDVSLRSQPATRHARSRRATGECVAAAGRPPRHGTARATPTRIANAAIPARLRRNGHGNGFAKRCTHGERATALRRPRTTGPARTHADAAAKRSNDYRPENGPHRPLSSICTGPGRRPAPTPSAVPQRLGLNAVDTRTLACAWPSVNGAATVAANPTAVRPRQHRPRRGPR
jgi:hypothetical protein